MLELNSAGHLTATDVCDIVTSTGLMGTLFGGADAKDGCGSTYEPPERALDQVSNASLAFFDRFLNDQPEAEARLVAALHPTTPGVRVSGLVGSTSVGNATELHR
jgi:hypothetical protein